jgi:hypothetical protein
MFVLDRVLGIKDLPPDCLQRHNALAQLDQLGIRTSDKSGTDASG